MKEEKEEEKVAMQAVEITTAHMFWDGEQGHKRVRNLRHFVHVHCKH